MRNPVLLLVLALAGTYAPLAPAAPPAKPAAAKAASTTRRPIPSELTELARTAITTSAARLPKGAQLVAARPSVASAVEIPIAPSRVTIEVTPPPRRAGAVVATAVLVFWKDAEVSARVPLHLDLTVPPEALLFDVPKGGVLTLVVRRGLIEVSAQAVTSSDADIGDVVQVLLRPSGRALRAQVVARDSAIAVEDGR
jgi:hypothetical protein